MGSSESCGLRVAGGPWCSPRQPESSSQPAHASASHRILRVFGRACCDNSHIACREKQCPLSAFRVRERLPTGRARCCQRRVSELSGPAVLAGWAPAQPATPGSAPGAPAAVWAYTRISRAQRHLGLGGWCGGSGRPARPRPALRLIGCPGKRQHSVGRPGFCRGRATRMAGPARPRESRWGSQGGPSRIRWMGARPRNMPLP
jgi:hypothetical protein